jgi:hypothetical protein
MSRTFSLGTKVSIAGANRGLFELPSHHLLTHGVIVGMTGSGKTGLVTVTIEEALRAEIPVLVIDVKGDLPNLTLAFPSFDAAVLAPWVEPGAGDDDGVADEPVVREAVAQRAAELTKWSISEADLADYAARTHVRVLTPGSDAGEPLHLLSALERRSPRWTTDPEGARATLAAVVSMVLRLIGREGDPGKSREHAFLCALAEARLSSGRSAELSSLLPEILVPSIEHIGALPLDAFLSAKRRNELAADLNTLVASPAFASWRTGCDLDVGRWMEKVGGKTPATIVSVAHLDDEERALVLGVVLEETLSWVRSLPGSTRLRALIVFDEVYGFIPPHPASPPTKRPLVALMKQARAYGVGCVLATQNPMDLDYRALANAGTWILGRLQTDADRDRVLEGLGENKKKSKLGDIVKRLAHRWFVVRTAKSDELSLLHSRWAMSYLRGPMTRAEIRRRREEMNANESAAQASTASTDDLARSRNDSGPFLPKTRDA